MQGKWIKPVLAALAVPVVTIGVYQMVRAYEAGTAFQPDGSSRDLQTNQVVFSGEEDTTARKDNKEQDKSGESELWEKDKTAEDSLSPELKNAADYLFQTGRINLPAGDGTDIINLAGEEAGNNSFLPEEGKHPQNPGDNYVYDVTGDSENADMVIGTGNEQNNVSSETGTGNGTGNGAGTGTGNGIGTGSGAGSGDTGLNDVPPATTPRPSEPSPMPLPTPTLQPVENPADEIRDPVFSKPTPIPGSSSGKVFEDNIFSEDVKGGEVNIALSVSAANNGIDLYKGQIITARDIFCVLDAGVSFKSVAGGPTVRYLWQEEDLNQYIRIDAISFDGGTTWIRFPEKKSDYAVKIPMISGKLEMTIQVSYRRDTDEEWQEYPDKINYWLKDGKIYVLSRKLTEQEKQIPTDILLESSAGRYPNTKYYNLYQMQEVLFERQENTQNQYARGSIAVQSNQWVNQLFSGWTENGEPVDWFYEVTPGRHIIEPGEMIPLDDTYQVQLKDYYVTLDDGKVEKCPMQTLRLWYGMYYDEESLEVPEGVQAIDLMSQLDVMSVKIPSTVTEVNTENLVVEGAYEVSKDNKVYSSGDGLLMDKEQSEILGIPSVVESLTIPDFVQKVQIPKDNHISRIEITAKKQEQIPQIATENLRNCEILVPEDLVESFYEVNPTEYNEKQETKVVTKEGETFYLENGMILNGNGVVKRFQKDGSTSICLANGITGVEEGAFRRKSGEQATATLLIMPEDGNTVHFAKGSFRDSDIRSIQCYSEKQAEDVKRQLQVQGVTGISVQELAQSREGYRYAVVEEDTHKSVILLKAPQKIQHFEGEVIAADGSRLQITAIGDNAFSDCTALEWVILPESVDTIGYEAFYGCQSLEGILIDTKEHITIGNRSLDNCPGLRFVASNAMEAECVNDYNPEITDVGVTEQKPHYFYTLDGATGYGSNTLFFKNGNKEENNVRYYTLVDIDGEGTGKMLYAANKVAGNWLALRSGTQVAEQVILPETTVEIYSHAMEGTYSSPEKGTYAVNWSALKKLQYIDQQAFASSGLSGEVEFGRGLTYEIGEMAFAACPGITEVNLPGTGSNLGYSIFADCEGLEKVSFGTMERNCAIYAGSFNGCEKLKNISFIDDSCHLAFPSYSPGYGYRFNMSDPMADADISFSVPAEAAEKYVTEWRYFYAGYVNTPSQPAYLEMWQDIRFQNIDWNTWEFPTDDVVDAKVEEQLLETENYLRTMFGLKTVSEPTAYYPYRVDSNGFITLMRASSETTSIWLDASTLGLLAGWSLDYVGEDAFSKCRNLQNVIFEDSIVAIHSNAFRGVESDQLTLTFLSEYPPDLLAGEDGGAFTFGIDPKKLNINVPLGSEALYYEMWKDYGVTIAGYDPIETTSVSGGNAVTVSGGDNVTDSTQEETVQ